MADRRVWLLPILGLLLAACGGSSGPTYRPAPAPSVPPAQDAPLILASTSGVGAQLDRGATEPVLSRDGSRVLFSSSATNVDVLGGTGNGARFVKDLRTGAIFRPVGYAHSLSADGHRVASFDGPRLIVQDLDTGERTTVVEAPDQFGSWNGDSIAVLSGDGYRVAFLSDAALVPQDTNAQPDVYVKDLRTGELTRASTTADGAQVTVADADRKKYYDGEGGYQDVSILSGLQMSADGFTVAFTSFAASLVPDDRNKAGDTFVKNLRTGAIVRLRAPSAKLVARCATLSADGSTAAFSTQPASDDDEFPRAGVLVARTTDGIGAAAARTWTTPPTSVRGCPVVTGDGRKVLVLGTLDKPTCCTAPKRQRLWSIDVPTGQVGTPAPRWLDDSFTVSSTGDLLAWSTSNAELPEDTNRFPDVYVRRLP